MNSTATIGGAMLLGVALAGSGGCAKAKPALVPDGLAVPAPPSRVLAPVEEPLAAAPALPDVPVVTAPPTAAAQPPVRRSPPVVESELRELPPTPPEPPVVALDPARELRAAPAAEDAAAERQVREVLARAARDLSRTDYRRLTAEGRAQYDQSKRFASQADEAIKERNLVLAATLADKAATLASALAGG
jgi:hypothetical protein